MKIWEKVKRSVKWNDKSKKPNTTFLKSQGPGTICFTHYVRFKLLKVVTQKTTRKTIRKKGLRICF